jgi:hypothetical protein
MRNFIINLLGGYTKCEYLSLYEGLEKALTENKNLRNKLRGAQKNDHRDERGRFKKAPK